VAAVMEHIELAGVHSGDSACSIPTRTIAPEHLATVEDYTARIAQELDVVGIINVQYAICDDQVYILEANPRASRTVPLVAKVVGLPLARLATQLMLGKKLADFPEVEKRHVPYFGVKEAVFPFNMFHEVDPLLGPEMKATGEVMGLAESFELAFFKAQEAAGARLPLEGGALLTVADKDKPALLPVAQRLEKLGIAIHATEGTGHFLAENGIASTPIKKLHEGRPNIVDAIINGELNLVINTPVGRYSKYDDSYIRMTAIQQKVPYVTTMAAAVATVAGIEAKLERDAEPKALQDYYG
jgi:carbamoyl-phosphate synthase large subunit